MTSTLPEKLALLAQRGQLLAARALHHALLELHLAAPALRSCVSGAGSSSPAVLASGPRASPPPPPQVAAQRPAPGPAEGCEPRAARALALGAAAPKAVGAYPVERRRQPGTGRLARSRSSPGTDRAEKAVPRICQVASPKFRRAVRRGSAPGAGWGREPRRSREARLRRHVRAVGALGRQAQRAP